MYIFANKTVYQSEWNQVGSARELSAEEKKMMKNTCKVVRGNYGLSVCFFLVSGGMIYIPVSKAGEQVMQVDQVFTLDDIRVVTLERNGDTIEKVELK